MSRCPWTEPNRNTGPAHHPVPLVYRGTGKSIPLEKRKGIRMLKSLLATLGVAGLAVAGVATAANAATPQCTAVLGHQCGSWNTEVPGLPDLDVLGGAAVSGNSLIVFTPSSSDKAEDFAVMNVAVATAANKYPGTGPAAAPAGSVMIRYTPRGVDSGLCVSTVNPNGHAAAQLRACSNGTTQFNPYQTFTSAVASGDFSAVKFAEIIHGYVMTDPANNGSIGVVGHRVHVTFAPDASHTGQFWSQTGA